AGSAGCCRRTCAVSSRGSTRDRRSARRSRRRSPEARRWIGRRRPAPQRPARSPSSHKRSRDATTWQENRRLLREDRERRKDLLAARGSIASAEEEEDFVEAVLFDDEQRLTRHRGGAGGTALKLQRHRRQLRGAEGAVLSGHERDAERLARVALAGI